MPQVVVGIYRWMCAPGGFDMNREYGIKNADTDFLESLDVISEIINKYGHTCDIILTGDMNASLTRQTPNSRDSVFKFY